MIWMEASFFLNKNNFIDFKENHNSSNLLKTIYYEMSSKLITQLICSKPKYLIIL